MAVQPPTAAASGVIGARERDPGADAAEHPAREVVATVAAQQGQDEVGGGDEGEGTRDPGDQPRRGPHRGRGGERHGGERDDGQDQAGRQDPAPVAAHHRGRGEQAPEEVADVVHRGQEPGGGGRQADLGAHHGDDRGEHEPPDAHRRGERGGPAATARRRCGRATGVVVDTSGEPSRVTHYPGPL